MDSHAEDLRSGESRWEKTSADAVVVGDRLRVRDQEMTVSRVEEGFLGRSGMRAFVEDRPERWLKVPVPDSAEVEVLRER